MEAAQDHKQIWSALSERSGFPEPYLGGKATTYRRWSGTYAHQLVREDIRDLTGVKSIMDMETLYVLLPSRVGSPISIPSLARDLRVSYNFVKNWLSAFERFFLSFRISPWTKKISRAVQKESKVYLWDSPRIEDPAARFENMVALELWRATSAWNNMGHGSFSLHYIKNKEQQEVDFLVVEGREPFLLIETKLSDSQPSPVLKKFQQHAESLGPPFRGGPISSVKLSLLLSSCALPDYGEGIGENGQDELVLLSSRCLLTLDDAIQSKKNDLEEFHRVAGKHGGMGSDGSYVGPLHLLQGLFDPGIVQIPEPQVHILCYDWSLLERSSRKPHDRERNFLPDQFP